ncbi:hypothetical protein TWF569_005052 [Orbilia oligospora]|uniref:LysM domain-containing protein n=1 Tax=Orbilia oligospora TaxID=2813651 RepID=A0A7C8JCJ3_ORBOL|nr:hypothetical protein TWF103_003292 [Orbilia oligospora]KAF3084755.1 hypothetical protein TWF706_000668 [Orbilia oligospora]KAF3093626.1 hypothetical protein TWF102_007850 [Orbilia oligospora]KAF3125356.1 hypothetical protein TWF594_001612 [Orbilia oligospora]KAF3149417.1 hypothetical protein TWF569_005052 [Orbilia oligospora]
MASERIMPRQQRPGRGKQRNQTRCNPRYLNSNKDNIAEEWGPSGPQASTEEPNKHNLRAALLANHDPKTYDHRKSQPLPSEQETTARGLDSEYVLVYIHKVQTTDTMAGVLLAYDIEPDVVRKANRLWPNDSIQMRSQLYLPVGECAVKGVPLPAEELAGQRVRSLKTKGGGDELGNSSDQQQPTPLRNNHNNAPLPILQTSDGHHSFVHIDPVGPVEIVRLARPKLSHFPSPSSNRMVPKSRILDHSSVIEPQYKPPPQDISTDTFERLETVGAAIETFVRRVAASARMNWVNKTTSDLIELTSHVGRPPQTPDSRGINASNTRNTNSSRCEEVVPATLATSNSFMVHGGSSEAPRNRRRIKKIEASEG